MPLFGRFRNLGRQLPALGAFERSHVGVPISGFTVRGDYERCVRFPRYLDIHLVVVRSRHTTRQIPVREPMISD